MLKARFIERDIYTDEERGAINRLRWLLDSSGSNVMIADADALAVHSAWKQKWPNRDFSAVSVIEILSYVVLEN